MHRNFQSILGVGDGSLMAQHKIVNNIIIYLVSMEWKHAYDVIEPTSNIEYGLENNIAQR